MKLQIRFKIENSEGGSKKASKTFSAITEGLDEDRYKSFAMAYMSLIDSLDYEVYLIKTEKI